MASPLQISPLLALLLLLLLLLLSLSSAAPLPPSAAPLPSSGQPPLPSVATEWTRLMPQEPHHMELLAPILSNLGYQELAMAVSYLYSPVLSSWSGPVTLFAPSDDSVRSCGPACSPLRLLREHLSPGILSRAYLSRLPFGSKIETASPGRCLALTSTGVHRPGSGPNASATDKFFVDGVEITRPDLYNDGRIVIHGLQGFVAPLSPLSCTHGATTPSFPLITGGPPGSPAAKLMLHDAIVRLRDSGYSILSLAMRVKYAELAGLHNMTVFALDDPSIFAGGHSYVTEVRFHVVPNRLLAHADLMRLPEGSVLPTLVHGQHLTVTHSGVSGAAVPLGAGMRINYVPIKVPDVVRNAKIAVHSILLPFPHMYLLDQASAGTTAPEEAGGIIDGTLLRPAVEGKGSCSTDGVCSTLEQTAGPAASTTVNLPNDGL